MALQIVTDRRGEALSDTRRQLEQMRRTADVTAEDVARLLEVLKRGELSEGQFASFRELVEKIRPEFVANLRSRCPRLGDIGAAGGMLCLYRTRHQRDSPGDERAPGECETGPLAPSQSPVAPT